MAVDPIHQFEIQNYFPIAKAKMVRYRKNLWVLFGPLVKAR